MKPKNGRGFHATLQKDDSWFTLSHNYTFQKFLEVLFHQSQFLDLWMQMHFRYMKEGEILKCTTSTSSPNFPTIFRCIIENHETSLYSRNTSLGHFKCYYCSQCVILNMRRVQSKQLLSSNFSHFKKEEKAASGAHTIRFTIKIMSACSYSIISEQNYCNFNLE